MACSEVSTLAFRSDMYGCVFLCKLRILLAPSPCARLSRLRVLWANLTPACFWLPYLTFRSAYLPCGWNLRASQVLVRFSRHMPRSSRTPADPRKAHQFASSVLASGPLKPSPSALEWIAPPTQITGLSQDFRKCGLPCGLCRSLCTLQLSRSGFSFLLNNCNTRYEWLVRPYSAGTFTLQETPSFAWRTNVWHQRRA